MLVLIVAYYHCDVLVAQGVSSRELASAAQQLAGSAYDLLQYITMSCPVNALQYVRMSLLTVSMWGT